MAGSGLLHVRGRIQRAITASLRRVCSPNCFVAHRPRAGESSSLSSCGPGRVHDAWRTFLDAQPSVTRLRSDAAQTVREVFSRGFRAAATSPSPPPSAPVDACYGASEARRTEGSSTP